MRQIINNVLLQIGEEYKDEILKDARNYVEVDIGGRASRLGYPELADQYRRVNALVPIKRPVNGMKVRIDGRTFVDYAQFDTGVVVPGFVARKAGLKYQNYVPLDSMILNFS